MSHEEIAKLEKQALELMKQDNYRDALAIWQSVLAVDPDWEHGLAWNEIGYCFEETGEFQKAQEAYKRALAIEPWNSHYNGSYCSFAYLHGNPQAAYDLYLRYDQIEAYYRDIAAEEPVAELALGARLGIPESQTRSRYAEVVRRGSAGEFPPKSVPDAL